MKINSQYKTIPKEVIEEKFVGLLAEIEEHFDLKFAFSDYRSFSFKLGCLMTYLDRLKVLAENLIPIEDNPKIDEFHNTIQQRCAEIMAKSKGR